MQNSHDRLIAAAARLGLAPLGLVRKGRSRTWIDDHGWWLINVEFQPSSYARGCYLNVGEQHLWVVHDSLVFEDMERPLGGSAFVAFNGDEAQFAQTMEQVVGVAAEAVQRRRREHGEGTAALRRVANGSDDLNGGIAAALLGDTQRSRARLNGQVHNAYSDQAASYLDLDATEASRRASSAVDLTRQRIGLPPRHESTW